MTIELSCPECGKRIQTADANAGKKGRCPKCQAVFSIPVGGPGGEQPVRGPQQDDGGGPFAADQTVSWEASKEFLSELSSPLAGGESALPSPTDQGRPHEDFFSGGATSPAGPPADPLAGYDPLADAASQEHYSPPSYGGTSYGPPAYGPPAYTPHQPAYHGPPHAGPAYVSQSAYGLKPHRGGMTLTFGIVSISCAAVSTPICVCCPWWSIIGPVAAITLQLVAVGFGIPAVIIAPLDNRDIAAGLRDPSGRGMNTTGLILGIVGMSLVPIVVILGFMKSVLTIGYY